eukprot:TRINITY_DN36600_c0_g1_i2.p2 TRINITY_DN36600_c0_g1~~TRINITY_DN36600_c0_g1_i2.p2  ORF type:complete len:116 (-),score=21.37 TRINITY_DN36600_c0_g1_i2:792-1139(-)
MQEDAKQHARKRRAMEMCMALAGLGRPDITVERHQQDKRTSADRTTWFTVIMLGCYVYLGCFAVVDLFLHRLVWKRTPADINVVLGLLVKLVSCMLQSFLAAYGLLGAHNASRSF